MALIYRRFYQLYRQNLAAGMREPAAFDDAWRRVWD